jgi:hypothetical protein
MDLESGEIATIVILGIKLLIFVGAITYIAVEKIGVRLNRLAARKTVQSLLSLPPTSLKPKWRLPAPESYILFNGIDNTKDQPFKAGILQLLADQVLTLEVVGGEPDNTPGFGKSGKPILSRGPTSTDRLKGSLAAIYHLWECMSEPRTIDGLTSQARQKYGSLESFTEIEVKPRLVEAGLYSNKESGYQYNAQTTGNATSSLADNARIASETRGVNSYPLTSMGKTLRDELKSRMAEVLRGLKQERSTLIDEKPQQVLLGAVVAVAAGRLQPAEETEMDLLAQEIEPVATPALMTRENVAPDCSQPIWIHWTIFDNLEKTYSSNDTVGTDTEQNNDGNNDSGDAGDYGGGGDWG